MLNSRNPSSPPLSSPLLPTAPSMTARAKKSAASPHRRLADSLASESGAPDLTQLYQDVLLKRLDLQSAANALTDAGERQLAHEMAVGVCEADGRMSEAERRFLDELKALLKLDAPQVEQIESEADAIVELS